ncbi:MAG: penicillin-binding protein 2 [Chlamydiae bacterium]|nr:penicillin-binding protein 2 [Chlamydiota bacterium]
MDKPSSFPPQLKDLKRLLGVALFVIFLFSMLIIQFYKIQIMEGPKWTKYAKAQHQILVQEPAKRGLFYSNTSIKTGHPQTPQPFVIDVPKYHLYADPLAIPAQVHEEIVNTICHSFGWESKSEERLKLLQQLGKKSHSRKLILWMNQDVRDQIQAWWLSYASKRKIARNALYFVEDYKRSYPFGKMLGQVIHTIREDKDPATQQNIPTGGLELMFDKYLEGKHGKRLLLRSPRHPMDIGKVLERPEDGADIFLTINHYIQAIAEEEIAKAVQKSNAKAGWAVMMDPTSGEILALAQYPWFEPSSYRQFFNDPEKLEDTKVKALTNAYEPGSTFKPITLAIALQANADLKKMGKPPLFNPEDKMDVSNAYFPGRSKPIREGKPHRFLNMDLALQKSSNIYMARLAQKIVATLGVDWYRDRIHRSFGFGSKTGVEIPSESAGMVPTPGKKYGNGTLEWSVPTPFSLAIGHNLLVTSMQMLRAYAMIANGGYQVVPTVVRKIVKKSRDGSQEIILDNTSEERIKSFSRVLDPDIAAQMISVLKLTTKPGGTAAQGEIYGYTEAGKTGTSEKIINGVYSKTINFSSFIGFAPAVNPKFVLFIGIDEPEHKYVPGIGKNQMGGACAAPAFREIATRTLRYLGVTPDDPHGVPSGDPRYDPTKADCVEKCKQLQELYRKWNEGL